MVAETNESGNARCVLPDGLQQRRLADVFVAGDECQTLRPRRGADQAVGRIVRVVIWKLRCQGGDFWRDCFDSDAFN